MERYLKNWHDFCNLVEIETVQNVLDSPVWYNKNLINGHNFCLWDWFKRGIRQVSDLYDEQGNLCSFETLKVRFGLKDTFLEYLSLIKKFQHIGTY